jgi:hypothetical protein
MATPEGTAGTMILAITVLLDVSIADTAAPLSSVT